ncbi:Maleylacetoacetate isomerase [Pseudocercospora fuligena]|uniref:Maleylacetoacetate isomerase n=1 Tax=Pseudocercospora fuligena TaxID=685502 RepID=A0A8H6VD64_9PEZI|nr:Maleylacetoacetate isomerase [Pseudocercospora fuligena]
MANPYMLHTNWRSTCSSRLRIALNLKHIPYKPIYVNLDSNEQGRESYLALNPSGTVPCLQNQDGKVLITQSLAAIEYLDEVHPDSRLLPLDPEEKALVRSMAYILAIDIQPLTSTRVGKDVVALGGSAKEWSRKAYEKGLGVFEARLAEDGNYSCGNYVTMADVCLVAAVWKALMLEVEVEVMFPRIWRVYLRMMEMREVREAHWREQEDCPASVLV